MKYAHYDEINGKLIGYYDNKVHSTIPLPNIEISQEEWRQAINKNYNCVDIETNSLKKVDFRSPQQIADALKKDLETGVQKFLDKTAKEAGYDNMLSACSYAGFENAYQAEGQALLVWRSDVWTYCYNVLNAVASGDREIPTKAELLSELPTYEGVQP